MEYLIEYLLFTAKLVTVVLILGIPVMLALVARQARRPHPGPEIDVCRVNDVLQDTVATVDAALLPPKVFKQKQKEVNKAAKARAASPNMDAARTYLCEFDGDIRASAVTQLREEITAILSVARAQDRVIVILESGGGTIHGYGLAASQLRRIRERGLHLVVVVDRIAASGGYMMACVANEIVAAPFAIIGSIGVVAQLPNFHRLLQKHAIDYEQVTAGKYKRTLTLFGENTDDAREKFQDELNEAHHLFKEFIASCRPQLDLERVASGEYWFATRALELGLVDRLSTSDDVIVAAADAGDVFRISAAKKRTLLDRVMQPVGRWLRALNV